MKFILVIFFPSFQLLPDAAPFPTNPSLCLFLYCYYSWGTVDAAHILLDCTAYPQSGPSLPDDTLLGKPALSLLATISCQQIQNKEWHLVPMSPVHAGIRSALSMMRCCACYLNCCEFICETVLLCLENPFVVFHHLWLLHAFSNPSSTIVPEPWKEEIRSRCPIFPVTYSLWQRLRDKLIYGNYQRLLGVN